MAHQNWRSTFIVFISAFILGLANVAHAASTKILTSSPASISSQSGATFNITYNWQAVPMAGDYTVFVHFVDSQGVTQFQDDHVPPKSTSNWSGTISYMRSVTVPSNVAAKSYKIVAGLYSHDSTSGAFINYPLRVGSGVTTFATAQYQIGSIAVVAPVIKSTCGPANGTTVSSLPSTSGLCASGTASAITGTGPWNWSCVGGTTVQCSASVKIAQTTILQTSPSSISAQAGQNFSITYNWQAVPMSQGYDMFVHFIDSSGSTVFQDDGYPAVSTAMWSGPVSYAHSVLVPSTIAAGTYKIVAGLYDPSAANTGWNNQPLIPGAGVNDLTLGSAYQYQIGTVVIRGATPSQAPVYAPIDSSYKLTFDEEFNGASVNTNRWQVPNNSPDTTYSTYTNAIWTSKNITLNNGVIDFAVTTNSSNYFTSGMTSNFMQTYGYWESRLKTPAAAHGIGADFWMDAQNWNFPEIDIIEWLGVQPMINHMTWHSPQMADPGTGASTSSTGNMDFAGTFHVFGMLWTQSSITWYIDGVQTAQTSSYVNTNPANTVPEWIILDATVGGFNNNLIDSTTVFPAHFQVDYVHVYSNAPGAVAVTPDAGYGGPGDAGN